LEDEAFPEKQWSDFPAYVLKGWVEEIQSLLNDAHHVASCHFMEGPYLFRVSRSQGEMWRVDFIERGLRGETSVGSAEVQPDVVLTEVLRGIETLVNASQRLDLAGPDVEELSRASAALRSGLRDARQNARPH
jgi:hypothetical protein